MPHSLNNMNVCFCKGLLDVLYIDQQSNIGPVYITLTSSWQARDTSSWVSYKLVTRKLRTCLQCHEEVVSLSWGNELWRPSRHVKTVSRARQARDKFCCVAV